MYKRHLLPMLRRFLFLKHMIFITSLLSLPSLLSSPLLLSSLLFSSLWSSVVSVEVVPSLSGVVVVFFSLFCVTASAAPALLLLFLPSLVAVAARAAAVGAAACGSCVFLSGYSSFRVDLSFCSYSLSLRPLLSSCQVHSARRVACT